LLNKS